MKRDLPGMAKKEYDLIVVGGGITGASVAWDASLRGISVALIDKDDFSNATSAATSKLIHGGLRYLKNFEIGLVRESLSERRILEIITPQFVYPFPFVLPLYGHGIDGRLPIQAALTVYDLLAYDKSDLEDMDKRIDNHKILSTEDMIHLFPGIPEEHLSGGALYYDCQMHTPERHVLEFILSAADYRADMANYAEVVDFLKNDHRVTGVKVKDRQDGSIHEIRGNVTTNVTGPWGDITLGMLQEQAVDHKLIRSKGIHLITRQLTKDYAIVLRTKTGRHFFIIPWKRHSIIGTTDRVYEGSPDDFKVSEEDIMGLIQDTNDNYPGAKLTRDDVLYFYGGLRPIVEKDTDVDVYDASRKYEIYDHKKDDNVDGFITVIGGKYTTSRNLARQVVDMVYEKIGKTSPECQTDTTHTYGGATGPFSRYMEKELQKHSPEYPPDVVENLILMYGTEHGRIMMLAEEEPVLKERIAEGLPDILAQVAYAVTDELALHMDDVLFRRTNAGCFGLLSDASLERVADVMGAYLGWTEEDKKREMDWVKTYYVPIKKDGDIPPKKTVVVD